MYKDRVTLERIDPSWLLPQNLARIWLGKTNIYPLSPLGVNFIWREHLSRYGFASKLSFGNVLDISCGTGYGIHKLSNNSGNHVVGVDLSEDAARRSMRMTNSRKNVSVLQMDNNFDLAFKDASFDTIVSFETIEHLNDPSKFVSEIKRILKPNGIFILSTPNKDFFSPSSKRPANEFHKIEFDLATFSSLLKSFFSQTTLYSQGIVMSENIHNSSSTKSRLQRLVGMIDGSQTSVKPIGESSARYFIGVCRKF